MNTIKSRLLLASLVCLSSCPSVLSEMQNVTATTSSSTTMRPPAAWKFSQKGLKLVRDEFNSTETPYKSQHFTINRSSERIQMTNILKRVLLTYKLTECCPRWANLSQLPEMLEEQRRIFGKHHKPTQLSPQDLLTEVRQAFSNITYLSIDGQTGDTEWEKYYKFYDDVQYYLRLMIVAVEYLHKLEQQTSIGTLPSAVDSRKLNQDEADFERKFRRQIRSINFKVAHEPTIASFLSEFLPSVSLDRFEDIDRQALAINENFELYETFIRYTDFGHYYARNISMVRESVQVFDLICSHLAQINFPSNLTRPSKQYKIIRRMSLELYRIRHELLENINMRILSQHPDVKRLFEKLEDLVAERPEVRMLGDEFGSHENNDPTQFADSVKLISHLLDHYTTNNMTQLSFYNQLAELPEDFILLGLAVAHEYETKEMPQYNRFYYQLDSLTRSDDHNQTKHNSSEMAANATADSARQSNRPFLSKLFG